MDGEWIVNKTRRGQERGQQLKCLGVTETTSPRTETGERGMGVSSCGRHMLGQLLPMDLS